MEYRVFEEWIGHVIISYHSDQWQERTDCTSSTLTDFGIQFAFFCRELVIKELLLSQGTWTQFVPNSWFGLPLKDVVAVCNNTCCRSWMEFIEESFYVCTFRDVVEIYCRHHRQPLPPLERRFLPRRDKLQESQGEASSLVQGWSYLFL